MSPVKRPARLSLWLLVVCLAPACHREQRVTPPVAATTTTIDESQPQDGGTLIRRFESDIVTINPVLMSNQNDRLFDEYLFTPMVWLDQNLRPAPGLADSWEISKDGLMYTLHLNPKATFSDGTPVKASDVLFTLRKILDPESQSLQPANSFQYADLSRTKVVDDHTIIIGFKQALAAQLIHFADLFTIPEHVYGKGNFKQDFISTAVGSGPYRLVRREPGKEIVIERRADFWGKKPYLQTVIFKIIVDTQTAWQALKRGDIDETFLASDTWLRESQDPELQRTIDFRRFYTLNYNYVGWNEHNPLFTDKRVRRALGMCVNLKAVVNDIFHGTARAMSGPFSPDEAAFNPEVPVLPYDPEGALHILNSLGWVDHDHDGVLDRDGKPFRFQLIYFAGNQPNALFSQLLQSDLKKIGVDVSIAAIDPATMVKRMLAGDYEAAYGAWNLDIDPDNSGAFHTREQAPKGTNFIFYSNPQVDQLLDAARVELDYDKQMKLYHQLHALLADDQPYTWVVQVSSKWGISRRLHGVREARGYGLFDWYPGPFDWWIPQSQRTHG